jgi:hypothetical protein
MPMSPAHAAAIRCEPIRHSVVSCCVSGRPSPIATIPGCASTTRQCRGPRATLLPAPAAGRFRDRGSDRAVLHHGVRSQVTEFVMHDSPRLLAMQAAGRGRTTRSASPSGVSSANLTSAGPANSATPAHSPHRQRAAAPASDPGRLGKNLCGAGVDAGHRQPWQRCPAGPSPRACVR